MVGAFCISSTSYLSGSYAIEGSERRERTKTSEALRQRDHTGTEERFRRGTPCNPALLFNYATVLRTGGKHAGILLSGCKRLGTTLDGRLTASSKIHYVDVTHSKERGMKDSGCVFRQEDVCN